MSLGVESTLELRCSSFVYLLGYVAILKILGLLSQFPGEREYDIYIVFIHNNNIWCIREIINLNIKLIFSF